MAKEPKYTLWKDGGNYCTHVEGHDWKQSQVMSNPYYICKNCGLNATQRDGYNNWYVVEFDDE